MIAARRHAIARGAAGPVELVLVAAAGVGVWRLAMGWDWSVVPAGTPNDYREPQSTLDWAVLYLTAMACAGWLALRGRPVTGPAIVALPLVVLSGWRMATATVIGANLWPIGLTAMTVTLGIACAAASVVGALLRHLSAPRTTSPNEPAG